MIVSFFLTFCWVNCWSAYVLICWVNFFGCAIWEAYNSSIFHHQKAGRVKGGHPQPTKPWSCRSKIAKRKYISWNIWVFPKMMGKHPKSSILIGFSIIFTIHFGGFPPIFGNIPYITKSISADLLRSWTYRLIRIRFVNHGNKNRKFLQTWAQPVTSAATNYTKIIKNQYQDVPSTTKNEP